MHRTRTWDLIRARTWLGACLALVAGATVPARHPVASPLPRFTQARFTQARFTQARFTQAPPVVRGAFAPVDAEPAPPADPQSQLARDFNARVPLAKGVLTPARPFYLRVAAQDLARATDCLAAAGYYEAGLGASDQRAVAQVVLNRVRHNAFPATVCGVVFQGSARQTGCQFTFTCDGSLLRRTPSAQAWREARRLATEMLLGQTEPAVGLATHYHTDWVSPPWDRSMDKVAAVRTHLFYRWRGRQSFDRPHAGSEPEIPMLARLSEAHRSGLPFIPEMPLSQAGEPYPPAIAMPPPASVPVPAGPAGGQFPAAPSPSPAPTPPPNVFLVTLPAGGSPATFRTLAERQCAGVSQCRLIGWTDPARTPRALPIPGTAVDAIAFIFERRSTTAAARVRWDCALYAPDPSGQCI